MCPFDFGNRKASQSGQLSVSAPRILITDVKANANATPVQQPWGRVQGCLYLRGSTISGLQRFLGGISRHHGTDRQEMESPGMPGGIRVPAET